MIDAWIGNLGKYNEGELVGEWVKFPTEAEELAKVFERIGIDGAQYEEYFLADYESDAISVQGILGEYSNLDEINYLAHLLEELEQQGDLEGYSLVADMEASSIKDAINLTQCIGDFMPNMEITTETDLGYYLIEEVNGIDLDKLMGENMSYYFDHEAYGRDAVAGGDIVLSNAGMYWNADIDDSFYSGLEDIPDEYRCFTPASVQNEYLRTAELDTEENYNNIDGVRNNIRPEKDEAKGGKPSLVESLKSNREAIAQQDKDAPKADAPKKDRGVALE